ncbi:amidohydrolase family protein [Nakamurella sp. YIM 132087]|uniref:Amidohydrolase family protein n=1 Tax=Nakamurella alba TaxID=2665158 RepID=A0A7K1FLZ3_9ACTN|nr:amidohydrolase family protein [Nakamurella alba]MTD15177.1 amidohydrolase family protein [Nakamurella alba]
MSTTVPASPRVDASVHIFFRSDAELRQYLGEPWASRGFPTPDTSFTAPLGGRYTPGSRPDPASHPGSDPEQVGGIVFEQQGFDLAVLHPMTVGVLPDWHLESAILEATNRMLVERWLDSGSYADRFFGTIRVNPNDIDAAVKEIRRWTGHPRIVQIGLPMQTQAPYGRPHYRPLWRAAVDAGLPVAIHWEMGQGITHPPTPNGTARTYQQLVGFQPLTFVFHLMNMIAEGVFEEFPDLKVVFADGAADMLTPMIWRMDTFGRPHLEQTPWSPRMPSDYLAGHVYFVNGMLDGPGDVDYASEWLRMTGKEDMLMFGSSYPDWQFATTEALPSGWTGEQRAKVLGANAADLYRLPVPSPVG